MDVGDVTIEEVAGSRDVSTSWDAFVANHDTGHHVQSWAWGSYRMDRGWRVVRFCALNGDHVLGVAQVLIRRVGRFANIGYLEGGPIADSEEVAERLIEAVRGSLRDHDVRYIVAQPPVGTEGAYAACGFHPSPVAVALPATTVVALGGDDDMLAAMKSKTRYNVRKSLRSDLTVRQGGIENTEAFHDLLATTGERQGFSPDDRRNLEAMVRAFPDGDVQILLADQDGAPVAGILVVAFGDTTVFKRGAWSGAAGSSHPNELLHWTAMQWATSRGGSFYDFDGIDADAARALVRGDEVDSKTIPGVTRFKLGFGGEIQLRPDAMGYSPHAAVRLLASRTPSSIIESRFAQTRLKRLQTK